MKKVIVLSTIIFVIAIAFTIVWKTSNNNKLNNALTFSNEDVKNIWVLQQNHGLSYDSKLDKAIAKQISAEFIKSRKKAEKQTQVINNYGEFIIYIFLKGNSNGIEREIHIIPKDDNSVVIIVKTQNSPGGSAVDLWWLTVESPWLSQYLDKVKKSFE